MASRPIYQMYAGLQGYKPKIWRRFQVMNDITVARLAYILMTLFDNIIPRLDKRYRELKDAKNVKLKWVLDKENEISI